MTRLRTHSLAAIGLLVLLLVPPAGADEPGPEATTPGAARDAMAKWVETQQILSKERKDWQDGKAILESRLEIVRQEIEALKTKFADLRAARAEATRSRLDVAREDASLQATSEALAGWATGMESELRQLVRRLPEPVLAKVQPLFDRMPADPSATKVSVAERFQNIVGILNEVGKFNNEITLSSEVRTLSDGHPAEVRCIYVGLAQAYFLSGKGEAGIGRPSADGWDWQSAPELAPRILQIVEVLQNKAKPSFVPLPAKIQ